MSTCPNWWLPHRRTLTHAPPTHLPPPCSPLPLPQAKRRWRLMAKAVGDHRDLDFPDLVDQLVERYLPALKQRYQEALRRQQQEEEQEEEGGGAAGDGDGEEQDAQEDEEEEAE